jgi:two-component system, NtrC family, response regulator AtoC
VRPLLLVLIAIQDAKTRSFTRMVLEGAGHRIVEVNGCKQAHSLLSNGLDPDVLLCDGPALGGAETQELHQFLASLPAHRIWIIAGVGDQDVRKEAGQLGLSQFIDKPVTRNDLESAVDALGQSRDNVGSKNSTTRVLGDDSICAPISSRVVSSAHNIVPAGPYVEELENGNFFLAASPQMLEIHRQVKLLADIDVNVLILGESGTGKEVIAQLIHKNSRRAKEKFLKVNCAALPAELLESELFGHRRGAFTGAINDRPGKFEQANRGTLLLDEIGEIGVPMQAKLLHVLQDGQFARLGAQETTKVDVRVLAATNILIEDAMLEKRFREDLYYRLSVFTIKVPPLRERREDIPFFVEQMVRRAPAELTNGAGGIFSDRLMDAALAYDWRGNVRELRNFVTRAIVMRNSDSAARELEEKVTASSSAARTNGATLQRSIDSPLPCAGIRSIIRDVKDRTETQMIQDALDAFGWNRRRTAQYLNISYRTLLYKIQQYRLRPSLAAADPLQLFQDGRFARQNAVQRTGPEVARG